MIQEQDSMREKGHVELFFVMSLLRTQERDLGVDCCPGLR